MNWLPTFISENELQALGWTLLHALWQGTLIAVMLSLIMFTLNKQAAKIRYGIAVLAQFTMLVSAIITFGLILANQNEAPLQHDYLGDLSLSESDTWIPTPRQPTVVELASFQEEALYYFESHLPLIVTLWLMGVLIFTLKMLGNLAYIQRLKSYRVTKVETYWQNKVLAMSTQMGIRKVVRLLESAVVQVPMVVGHLKPIILLPVGTITGLPPAQLEAILAHELAHVARHDYLVNILQAILEIVFFFHPGIWWISKTIRLEREHCCDDLAMAYNHDGLVFAKALTRLQEQHFKQPQLSMALSGKKSHLRTRIERLLNFSEEAKNMKATFATFQEGFITALLLTAAIIGFSFTLQQVNQEEIIENLENEKNTKTEEVTAPKVEIADSTATNNSSRKLSFTMADNRYVFARLDSANNILELFIEGEKIQKAQYNNYPDVQKAITKFLEQESYKIERLKKQEEEQQEALKKLKQERERMEKELVERLEHERALRENVMGQRERVITQRLQQRELAMKQIELAKRQNLLRLEREKLELEELVKAGKLSKTALQEKLIEFEQQQLILKSKELSVLAEIENLQLQAETEALENRTERLREGQRIMRDRASAARSKIRKNAAKERAKYEQFIKLVSPELVKDGILKSIKDNFYFRITEDELEINCVSHGKKFQKKYLKLLKKEMGIELEGNESFQIHSNKDCN